MTTATNLDFGVLLRRYRSDAGLTQEELAERAGLSRRGITALERGERLKPHPDTIRLLADALQLDGSRRAHFEGVARSRGEPTAEATDAPLVGRQHEIELIE